MEQLIKNQEFEGERPLYCAHGLRLEGVTIHAGESAIKEASDITAVGCRFEGKYPFWETDRFSIDHCEFTEGARAAIWYSRNAQMTHCQVDAPKMFREMDHLVIEHTQFSNALETLWHCRDVVLRDVTIDHGDYLFMHSQDIKIDGYKHQGNYAFQYCKNLEISNAVIHAKDSFWGSENIVVRDSIIVGEYLAWYSKNLRLINCTIGETQPLCYAEGLVLENCKFMPDADLAFEYSDVQADVRSHVASIKNPTTGRITVDSVGEIILDENRKAPADCVIEVRNA